MTGASQPKSFPDHQLYFNTLHPVKAFHANHFRSEPTIFFQAIKCPEWQVAMDSESGALLANGTWTLCPPPLD